MTVTPGRTALVLVDLQHDFLRRAGLDPDPSTLVAAVRTLLDGFRRAGAPVAHLRTVTRPDGSDRMPHWQATGTIDCIEGTPGVDPPFGLAAAPGEPVATKQRYRGFAALDPWLRAAGVARVVVAGVYTHACIRETAIDAYESGYAVEIAEDAVGSAEPAHAALTREWLGTRFAPFRSTVAILANLSAAPRDATPGTGTDAPPLPVLVVAGTPIAATAHEHIDHFAPTRTDRLLHRVPIAKRNDVGDAVSVAVETQAEWAKVPAGERAARLDAWADQLTARADRLIARILADVGKPHRAATDEVGRAIAHVRTAAELARAPIAADRMVDVGVTVRFRPLGVVGILMPWNNPLALPCGKIAPALAFGNAVVFKPAPEGAAVALALLESLGDTGIPPGLVNLVMGAASTAEAVVDDPRVTTVAVTGSVATGRTLALRCAITGTALQAELGGNNAAIVLPDAHLDTVVPGLVQSAYSYAGQRCTAIRRFVVDDAIVDEFVARAAAAVDELAVGDPAMAGTDVGPLISRAARDRVHAAVTEALAGGADLVRGGNVPPGLDAGAWFAPTLLRSEDRTLPIVREETFGPVAVIQSSTGLDDALATANGVEHGLVMAVCTESRDARREALERADVGIVQLGAGPLPVHADAPFGGWKASGAGPPEHGEWDVQYLTRPQAVYGDPA